MLHQRHHHHGHPARERIVDLEVMKLELRQAQERAARADDDAGPVRRPHPAAHADPMHEAS